MWLSEWNKSCCCLCCGGGVDDDGGGVVDDNGGGGGGGDDNDGDGGGGGGGGFALKIILKNIKEYKNHVKYSLRLQCVSCCFFIFV